MGVLLGLIGAVVAGLVYGMDFGLIALRFPSLSPAHRTLATIPDGRLVDWIIASASCFPVFPTRQIDGDRYIDGGYYDNLPIDMAIRAGADEVVQGRGGPEA